MARAPVSKTGGWGFESLHSCQSEVKAKEYGYVIRRADIEAESTAAKSLILQMDSAFA